MVHITRDIEEIGIFIDLWDPAMIPNEVIFVSSDWSLNQTILRYHLAAGLRN